MRILLLAPQPFYQERGTPIAVRLLAEELCDAGHQVDLLCYHEGQDIEWPGLRLLRIPRIPGVHRIPPGPSWKKVVCDLVFAVEALRMALEARYDLIHAVEESAMMSMVLKGVTGTHYVFDMDSSIPDQLVAAFPRLRLLQRFLRWIETRAIRSADAVVPMCDALGHLAWRSGARQVVVLPDISLLSETDRAKEERVWLGRAEGAKLVAMYVGNLQPYQGIELLLRSLVVARESGAEVSLVVVGGTPETIGRYRDLAVRLGLAEVVEFLGPKPVETLGAYLRRADLLVSPRLNGENTPMKVYSYLDSGRPVLATDLPTHRQVMDETNAMLAAPEPTAFGKAMVQLAQSPELRERLGTAGKDLVVQRYSRKAYQAKLTSLYTATESALASPVQGARRAAGSRRSHAFSWSLNRLREVAAVLVLWMDGFWF